MKVVLVSTPISLTENYIDQGGVELPIPEAYLASYIRQHGFDVEI